MPLTSSSDYYENIQNGIHLATSTKHI
uniref:Uncharacterized protein n=1 Tax=Anguilla anguilla TaxID=7936 RepID=A0A0E9W3A4_ANGAN